MFDACRGGCMAAKFFTGLPLDGPDPECVLGHGEAALRRGAPAEAVGRPLAPRGAPLPGAGDGRLALMAWFESVAEAQRRARRALPASVYKAILAGSERGQTLRDNVGAFAELGVGAARRRAGGRARPGHDRDGPELSLPVLLSPTGVQAVHPDGELAVARAAAARGTALGLSQLGSRRSRRSSRPARRRSRSSTGRLAGRDLRARRARPGGRRARG